MPEDKNPAVLHHMSYRGRMNKDHDDPAVAQANKDTMDVPHQLGLEDYLHEGEQPWTHFVLRIHPTEGTSMVGDAEGKPIRFLNLRLAREAIANNSDANCTYQICALVQEG